MYQEILDGIIEVMQDFGLISVITVSTDVYEGMTEKEIKHLESLLDLKEGIKWMLVSDKEKYFAFKYSIEPFTML